MLPRLVRDVISSPGTYSTAATVGGYSVARQRGVIDTLKGALSVMVRLTVPIMCGDRNPHTDHCVHTSIVRQVLITYECHRTPFIYRSVRLGIGHGVR